MITPRHGVLPAIVALWLATAAAADAQQKLTITVVTQPFGTQPQFTKIDQPILRDGLKAKSNGQIADYIWSARSFGLTDDRP